MENTFNGTEISVNELIALRSYAAQSKRKESLKRLNLPGLKLTKSRGRGIEFDTTREYQAGDDIRSMAWRVTARSLKPHIKVYHEEKERPVWLAVDLSPSLYFGTRCMFKSVKSIQQAALLGWEHIHKHERIGAVIAAANNITVHQPRAGERDFLNILNSLSRHSIDRPAFTEHNYLMDLLLSLQQHVRTGSLVFIISDFLQLDEEHKKIILNIALRAQVILTFVYDPFEATAPPPYQYMVTDGTHTRSFDMNNMQARHAYQQQFQSKTDDLIQFSRTHNLILQAIRTDHQLKE